MCVEARAAAAAAGQQARSARASFQAAREDLRARAGRNPDAHLALAAFLPVERTAAAAALAAEAAACQAVRADARRCLEAAWAGKLERALADSCAGKSLVTPSFEVAVEANAEARSGEPEYSLAAARAGEAVVTSANEAALEAKASASQATEAEETSGGEGWSFVDADGQPDSGVAPDLRDGAASETGSSRRAMEEDTPDDESAGQGGEGSSGQAEARRARESLLKRSNSDKQLEQQVSALRPGNGGGNGGGNAGGTLAPPKGAASALQRGAVTPRRRTGLAAWLHSLVGGSSRGSGGESEGGAADNAVEAQAGDGAAPETGQPGSLAAGDAASPQVFVFWDLDNKRCRGEAAQVVANIRRVAGAFGRVALLRAYGNHRTVRERYRALPIPARAPEQDFDFGEARQRAANVLGDVRVCALCGEMQPSLRKLETHFKDTHEEEMARVRVNPAAFAAFMRTPGAPEQYFATHRLLYGRSGVGDGGTAGAEPRDLRCSLEEAGCEVVVLPDMPESADLALRADLLAVLRGQQARVAAAAAAPRSGAGRARGGALSPVDPAADCVCLITDDKEFGTELRLAQELGMRAVVISHYATAFPDADARLNWNWCEFGLY
ncbi:hypothetical protein WJX81_006309 [Elliptochloris bilobata]|uniref:NYN domain-containing protein n=1 Tax=Elliptochloris bilobata TaxID=381761 RepID=A0AAW1R195_9CHLO